MKYSKIFFASLVCAASMGLASCDNDDIELGKADTGILSSPGTNVVYVTDEAGKGLFTNFSFNGSGTFNLVARTSRAIEGNCAVTFSYNADVLTEFNAEHETSYPALPQSMVQLADNGTVSFAAGSLKSTSLPVTISGNGQLDPGTVYALPLSYSVANGQTVDGRNSIVALVRDTSRFPGADKTYKGQPGMKIIGVLEVNDVNPLNLLGFTLQETGKQLFDMCVLFSANINYNSTTGRVYIHNNENVQAILDDADTYIRPLQERGIKVILSIMGNWDASGISTLAPAESKRFAQEVKLLCDTYNLDGVFLDDEYSDYEAAASGKLPGFLPQSYENASRMAYDIKMAQPHREMLIYRYAALYRGRTIDGVEPGQFMDYVLNNYRDAADPQPDFAGLPLSQAGTGSWECSEWAQWIPANSGWTRMFSLEGMREEGYGAMMIFNFNCNPDHWLTSYIVRDLQKTATAFYDQTLVYDGSYYPKDWR